MCLLKKIVLSRQAVESNSTVVLMTILLDKLIVNHDYLLSKYLLEIKKSREKNIKSECDRYLKK